ncbi:PAS domain-containing protein, partial [Haematococcus lacustris]
RVSGNSGPAADDVFEQRNSLTVGLYGLLYTISKEKRTTPFFFVALKLSMDFLQLFLLIINPQVRNPEWACPALLLLRPGMVERKTIGTLTAHRWA